MSLSAQAKVLRVLQSGELSRVGSETRPEGRRARARGHQSRPAGGGGWRPVSRGPLLSPGGGAPARAAAARARGRHPASVHGLRRRRSPAKTACTSRRSHARGGGDPFGLCLAGQRARAAQRDRAAGDPLARRASGVGDLPEEIVAETWPGARPAACASAGRASSCPPKPETLPLRELRDLIERAVHPHQARRERLEHLAHGAGCWASSAPTCTRRCARWASRARIARNDPGQDRDEGRGKLVTQAWASQEAEFVLPIIHAREKGACPRRGSSRQPED